MRCFFVTDLHGRERRYDALFERIEAERPDGLFLGGDLFPRHREIGPFMDEYLFSRLKDMRSPPQTFAIMGNDDRRDLEGLFIDAEAGGILEYVNLRKVRFGDLFVRGYSFVPPSPFRLKDWEKRDSPGKVPFMTIPPEEGMTTIGMDKDAMVRANIEEDLGGIGPDPDMGRTIFLCHAPPHGTSLDMVGYQAQGFDPHVGSRSIRAFIEATRPMVSLHGHIHESTTVTGSWTDLVGSTVCINGATEGPELCLVRFDTDRPEGATRELI